MIIALKEGLTARVSMPDRTGNINPETETERVKNDWEWARVYLEGLDEAGRPIQLRLTPEQVFWIYDALPSCPEPEAETERGPVNPSLTVHL